MSQAETAELLQGIKGKRKQHGFGGQSGFQGNSNYMPEAPLPQRKLAFIYPGGQRMPQG